ncbi:MAG: cytochrome c-type biosis protein [Clostridia bacterium]|nr:cytochrome c-type biosis protein [Clostridia bacterium]
MALVIGIITSFNPCLLTMLPLIIGYIGGYSAGSKLKGFLLSLSFVLGLSITFATMGLVAATLGLVFGQGLGSFWPYITGAIAIVMGLNLLGLLNFNFPGLQSAAPALKGYGGAFVLGLTFGFVASPCATPVLAVLLTFIASTGQPVYGGLALFAYGFGQGLPLIVIGTFTSILKSLDKAKSWSDKIKQISGIILVIFGIYLLMYA